MVFFKTKLYIKLFTIAIVACGILGYAFWRSENFLRGPTLIIDTPQNGATVSESLVTIAGRAKNVVDLRLNGRSIFMDEEGNVHEEQLLLYGYNLIELRAKDKFGKEKVQTLTLVYK